MNQVQVVLEAGGPADPTVSAGPVELTADGQEAMKGPEGLKAGTEGVYPVAGYKYRRSVTVDPRGGDDVLDRDVRDSRRSIGRESAGPFGQGLETFAPLVDEFGIEALFLDHDLDHGQCDGGVGARPWPQPEVGAARDRRLAWIDNDDLAAALLERGQCTPLHRICGVGVASYHQG